VVAGTKDGEGTVTTTPQRSPPRFSPARGLPYERDVHPTAETWP